MILESLKLTRNSENYVYLKCSTRIRQIDIVCFQTGYQNLKVIYLINNLMVHVYNFILFL